MTRSTTRFARRVAAPPSARAPLTGMSRRSVYPSSTAETSSSPRTATPTGPSVCTSSARSPWSRRYCTSVGKDACTGNTAVGADPIACPACARFGLSLGRVSDCSGRVARASARRQTWHDGVDAAHHVRLQRHGRVLCAPPPHDDLSPRCATRACRSTAIAVISSDRSRPRMRACAGLYGCGRSARRRRRRRPLEKRDAMHRQRQRAAPRRRRRRHRRQRQHHAAFDARRHRGHIGFDDGRGDRSRPRFHGPRPHWCWRGRARVRE